MMNLHSLPASGGKTASRRTMTRALACAAAVLLTLGLQTLAAAKDTGPGPKGSNQRTQFCRMQWLDCSEDAEKECGELKNPGPYCLADKTGSCNSAETRCLDRARVQAGTTGNVGGASGGVFDPGTPPPTTGGTGGATTGGFGTRLQKGGTVSPSP